MKHLRFVPPNYRCKVADGDGHEYDMYFYAESEEDLRETIERERFDLVSFAAYDFSEWQKRAAEAERKASSGYTRKDFKFSNHLWAELKQYLFTLSGGACGYCEAQVRITGPGDVEHYRPKRGVEEDPTHPGYFWLAYDVSNYVPCCTNCNGARAKKTHFPVAADCRHAREPEGLAGEQPLLLNPFHEEEPVRHFRFIGPEGGKRFGFLEGITPEGRASEKIYHLNRPDVVKARCDAYEDLDARWKLVVADREKRQKVVEEAMAGMRPFSLMRQLVLLDWLEAWKWTTRQEYEANMRSLENDLQMLGSPALAAARSSREDGKEGRGGRETVLHPGGR